MYWLCLILDMQQFLKGHLNQDVKLVCYKVQD